MSATHINNHSRVLVVADWSVDAGTVIDALRAEDPRTVFGLLVPARLPGLGWIGDPTASRPCAESLLREVERGASRHGLGVELAQVGDPERVGAILDVLETWPASRVLLLEGRPAPARHPFSVERRVARATGSTVQRIPLPAADSAGQRSRRRGGRCVPVASIGVSRG